jgi:hypothetical protein
MDNYEYDSDRERERELRHDIKREYYKQIFPEALFKIDIDIGKLDNILHEGNTINLSIDYPCTYNKPNTNISVDKQTDSTLIKAITFQSDDEVNDHLYIKMDWDNTLLTFAYKNIKKITIKDCIQLLIDIQYKPCDGHYFLEAFDLKYDTEYGEYFDIHFGS